MKKSRFLHVHDQFSASATPLRKEFDAKFADPSESHSARFVWDYWHVPNQYTLLRTPAYHYFNPKTYSKLHHQLVHWGRKHLGCWDISPPWMSCYVEGCKQELHSDVPHGAWAYVFSLSPQKPVYTGGQTLILRPEVLNYWQNFSSAIDRERGSFIQEVSAKFNRLIVFDPRFPHGVSEVRGTHDPREGRLVIHGWFTQPKTYLDGYLSGGTCEKILNSALDQVSERLLSLKDLPENQMLQGTLAIGISVRASGEVSTAKFMTNTVLNAWGDEPKQVLREVLKIYASLKFPKAKGPTWLTVPLLF